MESSITRLKTASAKWNASIRHAKADDMETWNLLLFIRHLPEQTAEELNQMEQLTPKTEKERLEEDKEQNLHGGSTKSSKPNSHNHLKGETT
jgi:hypothetical protein